MVKGRGQRSHSAEVAEMASVQAVSLIRVRCKLGFKSKTSTRGAVIAVHTCDLLIQEAETGLPTSLRPT